MIRVGINGFGRIGRRVFRSLLEQQQIQVVAINDLANAETMAHLLKYDSVHGKIKASVSYENSKLIVNGKPIALTQYNHPTSIDWAVNKVDIVLEATGKFKTKKQLQKHLDQGVKKVILTVPPVDNSIKTIVLGVNENSISDTDQILSNASCTTNNAAPMLSIINDLCGIEQAYITTVHSYTTDQSLHDQPHSDLRRARAAGQSIVPTTTGAAKALTKIFPQLSDRIGGCGIRVPVINGSLTDITFNVKRETSVEAINNAFKTAAQSRLKGIVQYTEDPIVSIDVVGNSHSCVFDSKMTSVLGKMVKVIGWYDNETGYSSRIIELIRLIN